MPINEKEFAVIREISSNNKPTQRYIAKKVGISLGLTNLIVRRLIKEGYIKIHEAPPRTIIYMLTPKGLVEKATKSYHFTLKTINLIKSIKEDIQNIIVEKYKQGARKFLVSGRGELAALAEMAFRDLELKNIDYSRLEDKTVGNKPICNLLINVDGKEIKIDLLYEISKRR